MWFFWKYVRGAGFPQSTADARRRDCRAFSLPEDVWAPAIGAGILGLWALLLFQGVYGRLVHLPTQSTEDLSGVPMFTVFALLTMSAVVAGITEESGLRGYMQRPLEEHYGPVVAILVTGMMFGFLHFTHKEMTIALMPWYMGVALVYGALAYLTGSILPCVVLHAGGNILGAFLLLATGRAEWETTSVSKTLIWESGADAAFWLTVLGFGAVTTAAIWAYVGLARVVRNSRIR